MSLFRICFLLIVSWTLPCISEEVTVVLAGTSEIGQEVVKVLCEREGKVLVLGRNQENLKELCKKYTCQSLKIDFED